MAKFNVGDQVKAAKGSQKGNIGTVEKVIALPWIETEYQVGFSAKPHGMTLLESSLLKASYSDTLEYITETVKSIGAISTAFTEVDMEFLTESLDPSAIKTVAHKDVTSKHFVDWFFKLEDWVTETPEQFPYFMITHSDDVNVYGYFNGSKLDSIICVEEFDDSYGLSFFCVNAAMQHQGIGQYLFQFVLNKFRDKKLTLNVYTNNIRAIYIYKKYGFKVVGIEYGKGCKPNSPHYVMQRDIHDSLLRLSS